MNYSLFLSHYAFAVQGCPESYEIAKKDSIKICLNESCPIQTDISLVDCTKLCSERTSCYLFKHKNVGRFGECFLYGFDENDGMLSDSECENTIGTICCQKGLSMQIDIYVHIKI